MRTCLAVAFIAFMTAAGCGGGWTGEPLATDPRHDDGVLRSTDKLSDLGTTDDGALDLAHTDPPADLAHTDPPADLAHTDPPADFATSTPPDELAAARAHNVEQLNYYRALVGATPVVDDPTLDVFATAAALELQTAGGFHTYFQHAIATGTLWSSGFCHLAAENQAPGGWGSTVNGAIDNILAAMWAEGPGGGHHDNMAEPSVRRVGLGLIISDHQLTAFSNDFSPPCP